MSTERRAFGDPDLDDELAAAYDFEEHDPADADEAAELAQALQEAGLLAPSDDENDPDA